jgi:hypothetical protein
MSVRVYLLYTQQAVVVALKENRRKITLLIQFICAVYVSRASALVPVVVVVSLYSEYEAVFVLQQNHRHCSQNAVVAVCNLYINTRFVLFLEWTRSRQLLIAD